MTSPSDLLCPRHGVGAFGSRSANGELATAPILHEERHKASTQQCEEPSSELYFHPCGAWDFPMSRGEKVRRLLLVFEAEAKTGEQELLSLQRENGALRARAEAAEAVAEAMAKAAEQQRTTAEAIAEAARAVVPVRLPVAAECRAADRVMPLQPEGPSPPPLAPMSPRTSHPGTPVTPRRTVPTPLPAAPRTRRRTTIFAIRDNDTVVRIPRRTAPPLAAAPLAPTIAPSTCHNQCWEGFADDSDDDVMTPRSASSAASASAQTLRTGVSASQPGFLTTPDGIQIVVQESRGSGGGEWQGLVDQRWDPSAQSPLHASAAPSPALLAGRRGSRGSSGSHGSSNSGAECRASWARRQSPRHLADRGRPNY